MLTRDHTHTHTHATQSKHRFRFSLKLINFGNSHKPWPTSSKIKNKPFLHFSSEQISRFQTKSRSSAFSTIVYKKGHTQHFVKKCNFRQHSMALILPLLLLLPLHRRFLVNLIFHRKPQWVTNTRPTCLLSFISQTSSPQSLPRKKLRYKNTIIFKKKTILFPSPSNSKMQSTQIDKSNLVPRFPSCTKSQP